MKARQMVERHAAAKESTAPEHSGQTAEQISPPTASTSAATEPTKPISAPPGASNEEVSAMSTKTNGPGLYDYIPYAGILSIAFS